MDVISGLGKWMCHWVLDNTFHLIMKYPYSSCICALWQSHFYVPFDVCKLFFIPIIGLHSLKYLSPDNWMAAEEKKV